MALLRYWLRIVAAGIALSAAYCALLSFPQPLFGFSVRADRLILRSDQPFSTAAAKNVLELARVKLATSPIYLSGQEHAIYICNARWRQRLLFNKDYGVGGVAPYPVSRNVFLRDASIETNRLIGPRGNPVPDDRTLDYFIAHEITHQLTGQALGPVRYLRLPPWVREGYADYVGKGGSFHYDEARRAFLAGAPEMDWRKSGLYWRYNLLVAHLLDRRHWTVQRLLHDPPAQQWVEDEIRAFSSPAPPPA